MAATTNGRDVSGTPAATFDHSLRGEPTNRPIWTWLTLLAVLLLPVDVAVRRLALNRRDLARAWDAVRGRWRGRAAAPPRSRSEQVARLFEAKERAGTSHSGEEPARKQATLQEEKAPAAAEPTSQPADAPAQGPETPPSSAEGGSLAARLLQRRRQQTQEEEGET